MPSFVVDVIIMADTGLIAATGQRSLYSLSYSSSSPSSSSVLSHSSSGFVYSRQDLTIFTCINCDLCFLLFVHRGPRHVEPGVPNRFGEVEEVTIYKLKQASRIFLMADCYYKPVYSRGNTNRNESGVLNSLGICIRRLAPSIYFDTNISQNVLKCKLNCS